MKNLFATIIVMLCAVFAQAQNYVVLHIEEVSINGEYFYCVSEYDGVVIYAHDCAFFEWNISYGDGTSEYYQNLDSIVIGNVHSYASVNYTGCGLSRGFTISFLESEVENPFSEPIVWKRQGESITLFAESYGYSITWSTGETTNEIQVTDPGIYSVTIVDTEFAGCVNQTFSIEVRDNVEIYRAGVDPATNKNRVLWQTTPEQAAYISNVKVERDGMVVGTVPYLDGQFLDNIGSENAARIYRITGIASDGTECPIPSYQFGTFNTIYSPDIANPNLMNFSWEDPFIEEGSPYEVIAYRIGRVDNSGEFIVIDQLSANVHLGKYDMDLFNGDYGIVAAVFNDSKRDYEELAFSNRSDNEILNVDEQQIANFKVYPNPTSGAFTVEGSSNLTIYNTMGQVIATSFDENGVHTISIDSPGVYFVTNGEGAVRKVVVK